MAQTHTSDSSRHVVIAGGSFAGLAAAYTVRKLLHPNDRVTVIDPTGVFVFTPSLVWTALGRPHVHGSFALEPSLTAKGIIYLRSHVRKIEAAAKRVVTDDAELEYDRIIIATGGRPDRKSIKTIGEFSENSFIVGLNTAQSAADSVRRLTQSPGPIVVGAVRGAPYVSAAYELALGLDQRLRQLGIRDRTPITFLTGEPYLGHLGFGQTAARPQLEKLFSEKGIEFVLDAEIDHVTHTDVVLAGGTILPYTSNFIMPKLTGDADIWKSPDLTDDNGFVTIDATYRHIREDSIYAVGIASVFEHPIEILAGELPPQTGFLSVRTGSIAGQNVAASLGFGTPSERTMPHVLDTRIIEGGTNALILRSSGDSSLKHTAFRVPGSVGRRMKRASESYLTWALRGGHLRVM